MAKILIVDDEAPIRLLMAQMLKKHGYECRAAPEAASAGEMMKEENFDLVLCDVNMPGKSGLDFVRDILDEYPDTATIMVTAVVDTALAESLLKIGVYDYITKPIEQARMLISVANALNRLDLKMKNLAYHERLEHMVAERTESLNDTMEKLGRSLDGVVHAIARVVETRDPYTAGHQTRVAHLARAIAESMKLPETQIEGIYMAGLIHDVGKVAVPSEILTKPTRLTDLEFELIKTHSQVGYDILKGIEFPWPVAETVYQHHERYNGYGYPRKLSGSEILIESRILAVADVVEAMASHRPYRAALGIEVALEEIEKNKGKSYDPEIAEACLALFQSQQYELDSKDAFT
jgi:putative two-component system response regulator